MSVPQPSQALSSFPWGRCSAQNNILHMGPEGSSKPSLLMQTVGPSVGFIFQSLTMGTPLLRKIPLCPVPGNRIHRLSLLGQLPFCRAPWSLVLRLQSP